MAYVAEEEGQIRAENGRLGPGKMKACAWGGGVLFVFVCLGFIGFVFGVGFLFFLGWFRRILVDVLENRMKF